VLLFIYESERAAMSANSRLTLAVHALTWMAQPEHMDEFSTSEQIAQSVNTNAVILRGLLGMLEKKHLVCVQRGSNAGWKLARTPEEITLLEVYHAVKPHRLFSLHHTPPNQNCVIGCGIGPALEDVYDNVQSAMDRELARTTVADILRHTFVAAAAIRTLATSATQQA
jgi:Rrf2 family protein